MTNNLSRISDFLNLEIRLEKLELFIIDLPQRNAFRSGIGLRTSRRALIVKWTDQSGAFGFGECACRPDPYYSSEFLSASIQLFEQFLFPRALASKSYGELLQNMHEIRGWHFSKAALEFAMHDALRRQHGKSLFDYWDRPRIAHIPVGISLGIQEDYASLYAKASDALEQGYQRLKFKCSPSTSLEDFQQLVRSLVIPHLSFDANGTFSTDSFEKLLGFAELAHMIEQPFAPRELLLAAKAKQKHPLPPLCLDESVHQLADLALAHTLQSLDELNLKLGRVGGLYASMQIAEYCFQHQLPCWVGGMFETGLGRILNLEFASFLPEARAHDLSPSSRYFVQDIVQQAVDMDASGHIALTSLDNSIDEAVLKQYTQAHYSFERNP